MTSRSDRSPALARATEVAGRCAFILVLGVALLWPLIANRQPLFFPDTLDYVNSGIHPLTKALHLKGLFAEDPGVAAAPAVPALHPAPGPALKAAPMNIARSPWYGLALGLSGYAGAFVPMVILQALAAAFLIDMALSVRGAGLGLKAGVGALAALATPLPFFVSFLVPDVWAGIGLMAIVLIGFQGARLSRFERYAAVLIVCFACLSHIATLLLMLGLGVGLYGAGLVRRTLAGGASRLWLPSPAVLACAAAVAVGALGALFVGVYAKAVSHSALARPPFLTARLIADGPGRLFIDEGCDGKRFVVCRLTRDLPGKSDAFLWGTTDNPGVWVSADPATQMALYKDDTPFAVAVYRGYPMRMLVIDLIASARQALDMDLENFNYSNEYRVLFDKTFLGRSATILHASLSYTDAWPTRGLELFFDGVFVLALGAAAILCLKRRDAAETGALLTLVFALLINAAICAVLSGVFGRYQARLSWAVTVLAAIQVSAMLGRRIAKDL